MSTVAASPALALVPSPEETLLRETVAGICTGFGREYMERVRDAGEPPRELWEALASRGYLGVNIPEEYEGGGLGMSALSWVGEEISAAGCALLLIVVSPAIVGNILARHGTVAQKERWLRGIGRGTTKVAFAITESDAGSNSHKLKTSLRREGDRFLLNGQKTFISAVEDADAVLVVARTRLADGELGLPSLAIVDVDTPGFTRQQIPMAVRGADSSGRCSSTTWSSRRSGSIGGENGGLGVVFDGLNPERIMGASLSIGVGRLALEKGAAYARERRVWGEPIGSHQGVAHPLAQAKIELELARLMTRRQRRSTTLACPARARRRTWPSTPPPRRGSTAWTAAIQAHGGNGFALEYGLSDLWWGVRVARTAPVSREMVLNYVAEHSLGLPKSY